MYKRTGKFATVSQGAVAGAVYTLDANLGTVSIYTFYSAEGFDTAKDTPFTVYADSVVTEPSAGGLGSTIVSVTNNTNEYGLSNFSCTTIEVDQRRKVNGVPTGSTGDYAEGSGWVYLGTYINPTKVVITASATVGTASTQGFVCAGAIGVDIGKYGRSKVNSSMRHFRYQVGTTELSLTPAAGSGISVIDLSTNSLVDYFGEFTGPSIPDGNISSADSVE